MYGIIGRKLTHSFSAQIFNHKFGNRYSFKLIELETLTELIPFIEENQKLKGFSVTIPYKREIIPLLSSIDSVAKECNAVNTVVVKRKNIGFELFGYNTDAYGFDEAYHSCFYFAIKNALILGTGGASGAISHVLNKYKFSLTFVSNSKKAKNIISYKELNEKIIKSNLLIVNTTPLGMYPKIEESPEICYSAIGANHVVIDLVYNPENTVFLQKCKNQGAKVFNGMEMLHQQAKKAWSIWDLC
jgi:shikimate dehydrogenase